MFVPQAKTWLRDERWTDYQEERQFGCGAVKFVFNEFSGGFIEHSELKSVGAA